MIISSETRLFTHICKINLHQHVVFSHLISIFQVLCQRLIPGHCCSVTKLCLTLRDPMDCSMPGFPVPHHPQSLTKFMSFESMMPSNNLILCHPLLLPSVFPSIRVFFNESTFHIRWPKYQSFSFSINPSKEYSGLISFRIHWFDLLAIKGTLKSLLQEHSSKASILQPFAFIIVQLSHPYMTTSRAIPDGCPEFQTK